MADTDVVEFSEGVQQKQVVITRRKPGDPTTGPMRDPRVEPRIGLRDLIDVDAGHV